MVRLRSPRPPVESARALVVGIVVLSSGCEATFGPPSLAEGGEVGGEVIDSAGPEVATTTDAAEPEPKGTTEGGGEVGGSEIDGGAAEGNMAEDGIAFDLGTVDLGDGERDDAGSDPPPPPNDGDCCEVGMGVGCADDGVESCVCTVDPYCCEVSWDELCVNHVEDALCGGCTFGPSSTDFGLDCCEPAKTPGCPDEMASDCVCDADPFCCLVEWDQVCIDTGIEQGCLECGFGGTTGDDYGTSGGEIEPTGSTSN